MNELVCIGKVINFFGIKGELKIQSDFEYKDKAFKCDNKIMIKEEWLNITSVRYHKNYVLIKVNNLDNINLITKYIGFNIYIEKNALALEEDDYLLSDLLGATIIDDGQNLGTVIDIYTNSSANYAKVALADKEYLIPLIPVYIKKFDSENKKLYTINAKSLII